jgi:hypothetical protein
MDFDKIFARIARNAVLEVAGKYKAPSYWQNRTQVGSDM